MWWLFGLINVVIVMLFAWFYNKKIKENEVWTIKDKSTLWTLLIFAFLSGFLGTFIISGVFIYLLIDFLLYIKK
jgi:hypothetical protein